MLYEWYEVINHLYYADDLVLLSPSALGMQKLLSECEKYASEYGMKFNENKSVVLNFNTLRPRQNGRRFADDTFKRIFLNENVRISIKISLKFVPKGPINNNFYGKSNMFLGTFSSCSYAVKLQLFMSYYGSMYTAFLCVTLRKGNTDNWRWPIIMYSEDLWVMINIAVPVVCMLKTELMVLMQM